MRRVVEEITATRIIAAVLLTFLILFLLAIYLSSQTLMSQ